MNKKILIGSIIAVVLLTLVSFSSVVGYRSVKSDLKIASPLFGIRTNRVNNREEKVINRNYLGKSKDVGISLFNRNNDKLSVQKLIERINEMDDSEIENLLRMVNLKLPKNMNKYFDKEKLTTLLLELNSDPNKFNELINHMNIYKKVNAPVYYTIGEPWYPGCFLEFISLIAIGIAGFFWLLYIITHPTSYIYTCDPCPT